MLDRVDNSLHNHQQQEEEGQREVECKQCSEPLPLATLWEHIAITHAGYRVHGCANCDFATANRRELDEHADGPQHRATYYLVSLLGSGSGCRLNNV